MQLLDVTYSCSESSSLLPPSLDCTHLSLSLVANTKHQPIPPKHSHPTPILLKLTSADPFSHSHKKQKPYYRIIGKTGLPSFTPANYWHESDRTPRDTRAGLQELIRTHFWAEINSWMFLNGRERELWKLRMKDLVAKRGFVIFRAWKNRGGVWERMGGDRMIVRRM